MKATLTLPSRACSPGFGLEAATAHAARALAASNVSASARAHGGWSGSAVRPRLPLTPPPPAQAWTYWLSSVLVAELLVHALRRAAAAATSPLSP